MKRLSLFVVVALLFALPALAQNTGSIGGVVSDPTGAVIEGAQITVRNQANNDVRTATSNASGVYSITNLVPGTYTVAVEKSGFTAVRFANTTLTVAQALVLDAKLSVGGQQTTVEVNGQTVAPVETESTQLSTLIESKAILDLPLVTRNPYQLVLLSPGTNQTNSSSGGFSVNGSRDRNNNFLLDGVDNNDTGVPGLPSGLVSINPDSTQEFRVITNNFDAEYGRNTGAIVDIVTRSGSNQLHGDAYWFGRYNALGARDFFNRAPDPQDPYVRNQFGFSVGGPIKKNRTFFFVNGEFQRYRTTLTIASILPTAAFKSGLFTTPSGSQVDLRTADGQGNETGMALDPTIQQVLNLLPTPPVADEIAGISGTLHFASPDALNSYNWTGKIDHKITDKHQLSLRFVYNDAKDSNPFHSETAPGFDAISSPSYAEGAFAGLTSTLSNTLVNDFKFGWNRVNAAFLSNCAQVLDPITGTDAFGNGRDFAVPDGALGVGPLNTFGCNSLFDASGQSGYRGTTSYGDALTWVHGNHTIKFGGDFRYISSTGFNDFSSRDTLSFNVLAFGGPDAVDVTSTGNGGEDQQIQDLSWMLVGGTITQVQAQFFDKGGNRVPTDNKTFIQHEYDGFAQDSWKIRPNLTLNFGLRYQFDGVPFEKNGNFSNLLVNPDTTASSFDLSLVGPGTGHMMYNNDFKDIEPRIGFAWDPFKDGKTSVRAGYGIFHDRIFDNLFGNARSNPPFQGVVANFVFPSTPEQIPFGASQPPGLHYVNGDLPGPFTLLDPGIVMPASQNWSFGVQRELPGTVVVEVDYVGAHATHVIRSLDAIPPDPALVQQAIAVCETVPVADGGCLPGDPQGVISGPVLYTGIPDLGIPASIPNTALQSAGFFPPTNTTKTNADASYHSLQAKVNKQFSRGLLLGAAYTWSHAIDDSNDPLTPEERAGSFPIDSVNPNVTDRGNSDNDIRQRFVANFSYQLPLGSGQAFLGHGFLGRLLEGIQVAGIVSAQTGHPYSLIFFQDNGRNGMGSGGVSYPDVIGAPYANPGPRINASGNVRTGAFNQAAFSNTFLGHLGDAGRNQFYGPHYTDADISLSKTTTITEHFKVQIRSECFNIFNHPQFDQPHSGLGSQTFGYSTATLTRSDGTTSARQIQLAVKLLF